MGEARNFCAYIRKVNYYPYLGNPEATTRRALNEKYQLYSDVRGGGVIDFRMIPDRRGRGGLKITILAGRPL